MPSLDLSLSCPIQNSFRVQQLAGLFGLRVESEACERFTFDLPELGERWQIGLIAGPSATGKSTLARRLFGAHLWPGAPWPEDRALIDAFASRPIKEITAALTAVGFGSPPSWLKPYRVLSRGEQFRCDLARALLDGAVSDGAAPPLVVFDEFTSVVDRRVAEIASAAVAKAIRGGTIAARFVAVTCHYDVLDWLAPDWVLDTAGPSFTRRSLRRPPIELQLVRAPRGVWPLFARHHYLTGALSAAARCYLALWNETPVAFCATVTLIGRAGRRRVSRLVTLPDYQGVGIGSAVLEAVAAHERAQGYRVNITASHPAIIAHCRRAPAWRTVRVKRTGATPGLHYLKNYQDSAGRAVVSFEYLTNP